MRPKKTIAALLVFILCLFLCAFPVSAESSGSELQENPASDTSADAELSEPDYLPMIITVVVSAAAAAVLLRVFTGGKKGKNNANKNI